MKKRVTLLFCLLLVAVLLPLTLHTASADTTYSITWLNDDGTLLATTEVSEGETPVYPYDSPAKETDADYVYTFYGWDPEPEPATADATYTAIYSAAERPDKCGDTLYWSFDEASGTLTITGSGDMWDFDSYSLPWYDDRQGITSVILPDGITSIGCEAFSGCSLSAVTIPDTVTSIHSYSFFVNPLTEITIPDSVISIHYSAFGWCTDLKTAVIGKGVTGIDMYAFDTCMSLTSLTIEGSAVEIGEGAFRDCTGLLEITMPCSASFKRKAFESCTGITSVRLTAGTGTMTDYQDNSKYTNYFGDTPWYQSRNNALTVTLDEGIVYIGRYAFYNCTGLSSITIPDSVTGIGEDVFGGCTGLTSIIIPDSVTSIGRYAFYGCSRMQSVIIGNGLLRIPDYAFMYCSGLTSVTIPDNVTDIDQGAFGCCFALTSVTIGSGVSSIGSEAFRSCSALASISIGDNIASVGQEVFTGTAWWNSQSGLIYLDYIFLGYRDVYPQTVTLRSTTRVIANNAMDGCSMMTKLTIPDNVTYVGNYAFRDCTGLTSLTMPCSAVLGVYKVFENCTNITYIRLTKGTGTMARYYSNSVTPWYQSRNNALTIVLDDGIETIGNNAFYNCTGLTSITLPNSVTSIGRAAFSGTGLTSIDIPDSVASIGSSAFAQCTGLTSVTIGSGEKDIEAWAFYECSAIADVYYNGSSMERLQNLTINVSGNTDLTNARWHYRRIEATVEWNADDVQFSGTTPYVIANGTAQTPRFTLKDKADDRVIDPSTFTYAYRENVNAGTGYLMITYTDDWMDADARTQRAFFKIYLPPTDYTMVENRDDGIYIEWHAVPGAAGYVIYRRAWSSTTDGWTDFVRWNNTTALNWTDKTVYAGTRYQYGIKAYFAPRVDPVTGATIGGNVGDNYNLGRVGPLKTTVRITTRKLNSVTGGTKQITAKWSGSSVFTGYQVQVATDADFTNIVKTVKITKSNVYQTTVKNLNAKTTYYVRVRSYHVFNGMTYYGGWSNVLSGKTK